MHLLAIEIGGSKLQLFTGTADGQVLERRTVRVDRASGGEGIRAHIREIVTAWQPQSHWQAVGVGYGGPVDHETGRICKSYHIAGWSEFPLGDWLRELTGLPVAVENDTNAAAYAEANRGARRWPRRCPGSSWTRSRPGRRCVWRGWARTPCRSGRCCWRGVCVRINPAPRAGRPPKVVARCAPN